MQARLGIAKSYQITNVFPRLTVLENVRVAVQGYQRAFDFVPRRSTARGEGPGPRDPGNDRARHAGRPPGGPPSRTARSACLEIAIALAGDPSLLLLDEPTAGMSPEETEETTVLIRRLADTRTVVLVEHKMKVVMKISDRITVLHQGEVLAEARPRRFGQRAGAADLPGRHPVTLLTLENVHLLRGSPHPAGRVAGRGAGSVRDPHRPQRRRQDDHAALHPRPRSAPAGHDPDGGRGHHAAAHPSTAPRHRLCRRSAGCCRTSPCWRISAWAAWA